MSLCPQRNVESSELEKTKKRREHGAWITLKNDPSQSFMPECFVVKKISIQYFFPKHFQHFCSLPSI